MKTYTQEEVDKIIADTIEACAKVCEELDDESYPHTRKWPSDCAAAIRARNMHSLLLIDYEALNDE